MCDKVVRDYPLSLQFAPDSFVTYEQLNLCYYDTYAYNDHRMIECYRGYKKRKAQKSKTKDELMPVAWHPSRWWNWCVPEEEKRETIF